MNSSAEVVVEVPPGVLTVMWTVPTEPDGEVAVHNTADEQLTDVLAVSPKEAVVVAVPETKPVPVIDTAVPPPSGPADGVMEVIAGTGS